MALEYVIRYAGERVNDLADRAILGGSCHVESGAVGSLTLELPPSHPMARMGAFAKRDATREVTLSERYADGTEWEMFRGWVTDTSMDADLTLTVECEGMLAYLSRTVVRPWSARALTGLADGTTVVNGDPFEWLVEQHNSHAGPEMAFEVGSNPHVMPAAGSSDYKSTLDELNEKFCTGLDRFLNARSESGMRYIDLLDGGAGEGTQAIVVGENVVEMALDESSREVVTAIIPRGQTDDEYQAGAGERIERRGIGVEGADVGPMVGHCSTATVEGDRVVNRDMVDAYGYLEEMRDYDATTPEDLARAAAADLDPYEIEERDVRAFDVAAVDLHLANPDVQPIRILDWTEVFIRAEGQPDGASLGRLVFHGWLPCTSIDYDLGDPSRSRYHFGDLPETLTRKSALRLGMLRRGNGTLVRRAGATEWNNDRSWNRSDEVWDHADEVGDEVRGEFNDSLDQWAGHLTEQFGEETSKWYQSLDDAQKENAQGREELLKHLDEVEGRWDDEVGRIDGELGDLSSELGGLSSTVDSNHRTLLDGIRDVAENAQRTFYGTGSGSGSSRTVTDLTTPGGESFTLAKGAVVDVRMAYASSGSCTLNVMGTGARSVQTNGFSVGVWQAGQVVRFVYDGSYWQACSTDIYGSSILVGNLAGANFYTNGQTAQLRIGSDPYWNVGVTGQTIGLTSQTHVDIGSNSVDIVNPSGSTVSISSEGMYSGSAGHINCQSALIIKAADQSTLTLGSGRDAWTLLTSSRVWVGTSGGTLNLNGRYLQLNENTIVAGSYRTSVSGSHSFVNIPASTLGISDAAGYAWAASNGDLRTQNVAVTGASYNPDTRGITVHFASAISGLVRVNLLGVPVSTVVMQNDEGIEGPEMFDDPESAETPDEEAI